MTDNGSTYKGFTFRDLLAKQPIRHKRTGPIHRASTAKPNASSSLREWAYAQPYTSSAEQTETLKLWLEIHNTMRTRSCASGSSSMLRLA